jgi:Ca-activated chloride channel family protein
MPVQLRSSSAFAFLLVFALLAVFPEAWQQPTFRSGSRTVAVHATVTDGDGRLVTDLTREDFEVHDNGKAQPLTVFSADVQPLSVIVMLDRSGSMAGNFRLLAVAAEAFVRGLLPEDKARIGTFATKIEVAPDQFTSDQGELIRILRSDLPGGGPTPLWNAVNVAIDSLLAQDGRRVVLVFTDGVDNPMNFRTNNLTLMDVMLRAQQENVMVYAIGLESQVPMRRAPGGPLGGRGGFGGGFGGGAMMLQRPDPGLPTIAAETGGGYFELRRAEDLASTFARVADELHRQYSLGFEPAALDGKTHKIQVKVRKPKMKVRARKNYVATTG